MTQLLGRRFQFHSNLLILLVARGIFESHGVSQDQPRILPIAIQCGRVDAQVRRRVRAIVRLGFPEMMLLVLVETTWLQTDLNSNVNQRIEAPMPNNANIVNVILLFNVSRMF